jgi:hypothetical protein
MNEEFEFLPIVGVVTGIFPVDGGVQTLEFVL